MDDPLPRVAWYAVHNAEICADVWGVERMRGMLRMEDKGWFGGSDEFRFVHTCKFGAHTLTGELSVRTD
jgi:hypothetical protein